MATYHLELKKLSKAKGDSAEQQYKYISRLAEFKKNGKDNGDDLKSLFSFNMPNFAKNNARDYWKSSDIYERKNACVAHSLIVGLQREFSLEQNKAILENFVKENFPNQPVTVAIHNDRENHNPHAHLMISGKLLSPYSMKLTPEQFHKRRSKNKKGEETGGAEKASRDLNPDRLEDIRRQWAEVNNQLLRQMGIDEISEKILEEQGIERTPRARINRIEYIKTAREIAKIDEERKEIENQLEALKEQEKQAQFNILLNFAQQFVEQNFDNCFCMGEYKKSWVDGRIIKEPGRELYWELEREQVHKIKPYVSELIAQHIAGMEMNVEPLNRKIAEIKSQLPAKFTDGVISYDIHHKTIFSKFVKMVQWGLDQLVRKLDRIAKELTNTSPTPQPKQENTMSAPTFKMR